MFFNRKQDVDRGASLLSSRTVLALWVIVFFMVFAFGFLNDYRSCQRSAPVRKGANAVRRYLLGEARRSEDRAKVETNRVRVKLDLQAARQARGEASHLAVHELHCFKFPPDH